MKKDKKEETMNLILIEEAWICITGNFSAFFGQTEASAKRCKESYVISDKHNLRLI